MLILRDKTLFHEPSLLFVLDNKIHVRHCTSKKIKLNLNF